MPRDWTFMWSCENKRSVCGQSYEWDLYPRPIFDEAKLLIFFSGTAKGQSESGQVHAIDTQVFCMWDFCSSLGEVSQHCPQKQKPWKKKKRKQWLTQSRQFKSTETITTRHKAIAHISIAIIFALFALVLHQDIKTFQSQATTTAAVNDFEPCITYMFINGGDSCPFIGWG